jgi:hypothetical protein
MVIRLASAAQQRMEASLGDRGAGESTYENMR